MKNLIARLVRAREEKNITLQDISYKTNIRLEILARIESGDTSFQPMPYIKAMLHKYAETVGMKLHQSDFEECPQTPTSEIPKEEQQEPSIHQPVSPEPISVASPSMPMDFEIPQPEQSHKKRLIYASLAGALIATLCVVWYLVKQTERMSQNQARSVSEQQVITKTHDAPSAPVREEIAPKEIASATSEIQRKPVIETTEPAAKPEKKHELIVRSKTDTCWISVASDKNSAKEMLLSPSAVAKFNADSLFTLTVGKLETAELWLNGKPVTLPRRSGAISGFKLTPPKD
ncbi:MAG: helix-turn-helix domain-containing protein [Chloroherpetonaceae bacterium]